MNEKISLFNSINLGVSQELNSFILDDRQIYINVKSSKVGFATYIKHVNISLEKKTHCVSLKQIDLSVNTEQSQKILNSLMPFDISNLPPVTQITFRFHYNIKFKSNTYFK